MLSLDPAPGLRGREVAACGGKAQKVKYRLGHCADIIGIISALLPPLFKLDQLLDLPLKVASQLEIPGADQRGGSAARATVQAAAPPQH